jgi:2-polyprenyl-6-methoxyphenol hydroxylase-like FAD-dependent oxidoreductase
VTLFEREPGLSGAGTALGLWPSAMAALDRIGVGDAARRVAVPQQSARILRADGSRIATLDTGDLRRRTGDPVYLLSRPGLLDLLRGAASMADLHFETAVDDVRELAREHDVVVAADGVFGRARGQLFGDGFGSRYAGVTVWRGWIDAMPTDALVETWGDRAKFGVTPQEGDRTNWFAAALAAERDFHPGAELSELRTRFGSWHATVRAVLDAIVEDGILRHDLYVVPRLPSYVRGNVALIGDAAHAMPPDLGRGACEALVDAVTLARCLADAATVGEGLTAYDRRRRRPTQRLAATAEAAARLSRWTRGLWLRDALVRASTHLPLPA